MLNKLAIIGNLGKEPEMSYTPDGAAITKFSVAVSRRWNDKASGEKKEETTWFNVVVFGRLAETCANYLHKGSKVYCEGRMTSHKYTNKDGVEMTAWQLTLSEMEMLSEKSAERESAPASADDIPF